MPESTPPVFHLTIGDFKTFTAFVQLIRGLGTEHEQAMLERATADLKGARVPLEIAIEHAPTVGSDEG